MTALQKKKKKNFSKRAKTNEGSIKGVLRKVLLTINILFVIALLFSYLAPFVNPKIAVLPALVGLAYPYLVIVNIFFVVFWATSLRWECLVSLIAILLGSGIFVNYFQIKKHEGKTDSSLKIISYNVRLFNNYEKKALDSSDKVLSFLKEQDADIICIQELYKNNKNITEASIKNSLGNKIYTHTKFIDNKNNKSYGIGTFSKYPIVRRDEIVHPQSSSFTIISDIVVNGDTIRIFNNHLQSFKLKNLEHSNFIEEITSGETANVKKDIKYFITHLHDGFVKRSEQAKIVKEEIDKSPYPTIVLGDFNDTPISYTLHKMSKRLSDAFVKAGYGAGNSYKGAYPSNRIDYILFDENFSCDKFNVLKADFSDHYPICAYFTKNITAPNN